MPKAAERVPLEVFRDWECAGVVAGFVGRVLGVDVNADRAEALRRLDGTHRTAREMLGVGDTIFATAEQVHGSCVATLAVGESVPLTPLAEVDGIITDRPDVCLGIYVADCCAVYIVDPARRVVALVHAGKKGTELGIVPVAIETMRTRFGSEPSALSVRLSPCIRPPWYEVDFAVDIVAQCRAAGVTRVLNDGVCTAAYPEHYYSYRQEKGKTGRMLALLALV